MKNYTLKVYRSNNLCVMTVEGIANVDALLRWVLRLGGSARNGSELLKTGSTVLHGETLKVQEVVDED